MTDTSQLILSLVKASFSLCITSRRQKVLTQSRICMTFWVNMVQSGRFFLFINKQTNKQKRIHVGLDSTVYSKQKACLLVFGTKPNMYDILSEHGAIWTWPWPIHHYYVNSVSKRKAQPISLAILWPFLVMFLPTTWTSFTKLRC